MQSISNATIATLMAILASLGIGGTGTSQLAAISGAGSGLVSYYTFDDGTATDSSGSNNGTLNGGVTTVSGKISSALNFNGVDGYVSIPDPANGSLDFGTESFSYSVWVNTSVSASRAIIEKKNGNLSTNPGYMTMVVSGGTCSINQLLSDGTNYTTGSFVFSNGVCDGTWHHLVTVVDRSTQSILTYWDNTLKSTVSISNIGSVSNTYPLNIGKRNANYLNGSLDDVRIYNRALSASEVTELYAYTGFGSAPSPINGVCGSSNNTCSVGSLNDVSDTGTLYQWQCLGSNGGTTASCSETIPVQGADTTPPSVPTGLSATAISQNQINLSWFASTDNIGVAGYRVYRNGTEITTTTNTSYQDLGLTQGTSYSYTVSAYDGSNNNSSQSSSVSATTQSPQASTYTLSITKSGSGSGTVTGGSINCGSTCSQSSISSGTQITLTATPSQGSTFTGWSGGSCSGTGTCTTTITGNTTVTATFNTGGGGTKQVDLLNGSGSVVNTYTTIQACASVATAGQTCRPSAGTYDERVTPSNSGTVNSLITFDGSAGAKVRSFTLSNKSYIKVIGFEVTNAGMSADNNRSFVLDQSTGVQIINNNIHDTSMQALRCTAPYGSTTPFACNKLIVRGNTFTAIGPNYATGGTGRVQGLDLWTNETLVENNEFSHLEDSVRMGGLRNVMRNNHIHDISNTETTPDRHIDGFQSFCYGLSSYAPTYTAANHTLLEGNYFHDGLDSNTHFALINDTSACGGTKGVIVRRNTVYNIGSSSYGADNNQSFGDHHKYYNNTNVKPERAFTTAHTTVNLNGISYASILNNIFVDSVSDNSSNPQMYYFDTSGTSGGNYNLAFNTSKNISWRPPISNEPNTLRNVNPLLVGGTDFNLQSNSPAIDAGGPLTLVATSDTGSGTSLVVNDAYFFQDGWAGVSPDWIAVGNVDNVAQISSINYSTGVITLTSSITRSPGNSVWLYKDSSGNRVLYGNAPDIGAYEYGGVVTAPPTTPPPTPPPTPISGLCSQTINTCITGILNDTTDSSSQYIWQCLGTNGGSSVQCAINIPVTTTPTTPVTTPTTPTPGGSSSGGGSSGSSGVTQVSIPTPSQSVINTIIQKQIPTTTTTTTCKATTQLGQIVELFISLGIIKQDKVSSARSYICSLSSSTTTTSTGTSKFTLALDIGARNTEVTALQNYLISQGLLFTKATGYFGPATAKAVGLFQQKYNLAQPRSPAYGFVGPKTRAKLNEVVR